MVTIIKVTVKKLPLIRLSFVLDFVGRETLYCCMDLKHCLKYLMKFPTITWSEISDKISNYHMILECLCSFSLSAWPSPQTSLIFRVTRNFLLGWKFTLVSNSGMKFTVGLFWFHLLHVTTQWTWNRHQSDFKWGRVSPRGYMSRVTYPSYSFSLDNFW